MIRSFILLLCFYTLSFASAYNDEMIKQIKNINDLNQTFSFAVYGDNRGGNDILSSIIERIDSDQEIHFSINNGDLVSAGLHKQFEDYLLHIKVSKKPIISILGNHGIGLFENDNNYKSMFGKTYFSFAFKNSYFIMLDDADDEGLNAKQLSWLTQELKQSQHYTYRFVFMHIPLYDPREGSYKEGHSLENMQQAKLLNNMFDTYGVTMLFCSHIHAYYRGIWHKTPYIISGGAGAPLKKDGFFHYIKVTADPKKVKYEVVKIKAP